MTWYLRFIGEPPPPLAGVEQALRDVAGVEPVRTAGDWDGNPRDFYTRPVTFVAQVSGDLRITLNIVQWSYDQTEASPAERDLSFRLEGPAISALLAAWEALRARLVAIGYRDATLEYASPAPIVDALEADGQIERAAKMRADITRALIRVVPEWRHVGLISTRPDDIGAVLRALVRPEDIVSVSLVDCALAEPPRALSRFSRATHLSLSKNPLASFPLELLREFTDLQRLDLSDTLLAGDPRRVAQIRSERPDLTVVV